MQTAVLVLSAICTLLALLYAREVKGALRIQRRAHEDKYEALQDRLADAYCANNKLQDELTTERNLVRMMLAASAPVSVAAVVGYQPAVERVEQAKAAQDLNDILLSRGG